MHSRTRPLFLCFVGVLLALCSISPSSQTILSAPDNPSQLSLSARPVTTPSRPNPKPLQLSSPSLSPQDQPPSTTPQLEPLGDLPPYLEIKTGKWRSAIIGIPLGTRKPRPIIVAAHAIYDRPEWRCEYWRYIWEDAWIVCPRGIPRETAPQDQQRYKYRSNQSLERGIDAAIKAIRERFPQRVDPGPALYTGFSQSSIMGAKILRRSAQKYPIAVLVEGGQHWTEQHIQEFALSGGRKILWVCGRKGCNNAAKRSAQRFSLARFAKYNIEADVAYVPDQGHTVNPAICQAIIAKLSWLLQDDPRWGKVDHPRTYVSVEAQ